MMQGSGRIKGDLGERTKKFALSIIQLYGELPRTLVAQVLGRQMLRSGTSVGAQCREAQRAKSVADFVSKIEGALQELDETAYWFELLEEARIARTGRRTQLTAEANELMAILVTMVKRSRMDAKR